VLISLGAAALAYWSFSALPSLVDDYRLGSTGTIAAESGLENGVCHSNGLADCEFDAKYITVDGTRHTKHVTFFTFVQEPNQEADFTIRYDAASPEHISTSWGIQLLINRTITQAILFSLVISMVGLLVWLKVHPGQLSRKLSEIGANPTPVEAHLDRAAAHSGIARIQFSWTDSTGTARKGSTRFPGMVEPFWLDASKTKMLALAGPNGQAHLLDADLSWVDLTDLERKRLFEAQDGVLQAAAV
jgi:hypothetical protein